MPKMGVEARLTEVEKGYNWPGTTMQRFVSSAEDLKKYELQRKKGSDQTHYSIWALGVGEMGQQMTYFFGHTLGDAVKKAYDWKYPEQVAQSA